jgi:catechol 2,3-dioxygenase-like lactoylglutathione lyase family enzyme/nitroreductase
MDLYEVMRTTSAVRQFTGEPLPDDVLHTILENARFAPSGGNRQGAQIVVARDVARRRALGELTIPGARRYTAQREAGEGPWNAAAPTRLSEEEIAATEVPDFWTSPLLDAAVVLVVCVDLRVVAAVDQNLDRVGIVGGASVYPLVWNILLAARNEGFGGTITTMAIAEEPRVRELFGIPAEYAVACVVPLGKPVRQLRKLSRVAVEQLTRLEKWDGGPLVSSGSSEASIDLAVIDAERERIRATYLQPAASRSASTARGLHHFAIVCSNVEQTIRFYQGVLGFPLTDIFENRDYKGSNHFFFDIGNDNLLAFFDFPGLDVGPYAEVMGGLHHVAISVEPDVWTRLKANLDEAGVEYQSESGTSIYFRDPDGTRLELIADPLGEMYGTKVL